MARDPYMYEVAPRPFPASQALPQWWRDMTPYLKTPDNPDGKKVIVENYNSNATFKKCTPMLDALTSGYIIPLWADVQIKRAGNGAPRLTWKTRSDVFQVHGPSSAHVETPSGYGNEVFKFMNGWIPKTPKGYSILVTQPFGYKDSPFNAVPAVLDSDVSTLEIVPPVWIKQDFEGIVEKGTPMVQLIPFKREDWQTSFSSLKHGEYEMIEDANLNGTIVNHYIKKHWSKKTYK